VVEFAGLLDAMLVLIPEPEDWDPDEDFPPFEEHFARAFATCDERWFETYRGMVAAMRVDVAPTPV
jgi:hypothetical protein